MYPIKFHRAVEKELGRLPDKVFRNVSQRIDELRYDLRPSGAIKLDDHLYRIRVGEYRLIYQVIEETKTVILLRVARRSEKTYRNLPS